MVTFMLLMLALSFYLLPSIIADARHHHNALAILMLNIILGWTFLGWLAALIWSLTAVRPVRQPVPYYCGRHD